ncbi:MAG: hypothetical protein AAFX44_15600 [Pseudomonadota bacterium]
MPFSNPGTQSMDPKTRLLERLDQIAIEISKRDGTLALLGLGSTGRDTDRLDQYSDLDFFVIVEASTKQQFIADLAWLRGIRPLVYSFKNTVDGHKALFDDGIFCEFAVLSPDELMSIPFDNARLIWARDGFDVTSLEPSSRTPHFGEADEGFLVGEVLTNLYVGLGRYARGERLSACFFIQHHAVTKLLDLLELWGESTDASRDRFSNERRFEQRWPKHVPLIKALTPGYARTPEAAERMLDFLSEHVDVNPSIASEIRRLLDRCR